MLFLRKSRIPQKILQYGIQGAIPCILRYYKPMFGKKNFLWKLPKIRDFAIFAKIANFAKNLMLHYLAHISLQARRFLGQYLISLQRYERNKLLYKQCAQSAILNRTTFKKQLSFLFWGTKYNTLFSKYSNKWVTIYRGTKKSGISSKNYTKFLILLIFAKIMNFTKFLQYGNQDAIPCILRYYKPMFGEKNFLKKITQNSRFRDFRENREFCKKFDVTLFGPYQSTSTPIFRSISHFITKIWKKQAFV